MRTTQFAAGELYHVYNRGVDKRSLFTTPHDFWRFLASVRLLNQIDLVTSIDAYAAHATDSKSLQTLIPSSSPLVRIHTYCINQNHFHLLLEPLVDDGIPKFMHRIGTSYTKYFNEHHDRNGSLFQGSYKSIHVSSDTYFRHLACYITLNHIVHRGLNSPWLSKLPFSAAHEFEQSAPSNAIADLQLILNAFRTRTRFLKEARSVVLHVSKLRDEIKTYKQLCID